MVKHDIRREYNLRRAQCEEGVHLLKKWNSAISALRDVSFNELDSHKSELPR